MKWDQKINLLLATACLWASGIAAGTHILTFLLLAKECGAEVDEKVLQSALK